MTAVAVPISSVPLRRADVPVGNREPNQQASLRAVGTACVWRRAAWFQKIHREERQSPHGRDGHAPFFNATILTATGGTPVL
jgi:hypothetical protein